MNDHKPPCSRFNAILAAVLLSAFGSGVAHAAVVRLGPPPTPVPNSPADGEVVRSARPTLMWWTTPPETEWYHLWISRNGTSFAEIWFQVAGGDGWRPSTNLPSGDYKWWLQAWNRYGLTPWSRASSFVVPTIIPAQVTLLTPMQEEMLSNGWPTFTWTPDIPAVSWYRFYLQRNGQQYLDVWIPDNSWTPSTELPAGIYSWWVQPWNPYDLGLWSAKGDFYYDVPGKPAAVSPNYDAFVITTGRLLYDWMPADDRASWYQVQVSCDGEVFADKWFEASSSTLAAPEFGVYLDNHRGGSYQWQVRGWSTNGFGPWSDAGTFSKPVCVPTAVTTISPTNSQQFSNATGIIRYQWTADHCANYYRLCITRDGAIWQDHWYGQSDAALIVTNGEVHVDVNAHCSAVYRWWVQPWGPDGLGSWSAGGAFTNTIGSCE